jgi:hypothetical protein
MLAVLLTLCYTLTKQQLFDERVTWHVEQALWSLLRAEYILLRSTEFCRQLESLLAICSGNIDISSPRLVQYCNG